MTRGLALLALPLLILSCCIERHPTINEFSVNAPQLLSAVVRVKNLQSNGVGTATCIYKEVLEDGTLNLYFLTVEHVVGQVSKVGVKPIMFTLPLPPHALDLRLSCWMYNKTGHRLCYEAHDCVGYYIDSHADIAILKLSTKHPTELLKNMPVVKLATVKEYKELRIGGDIVSVCCPYSLPPLYIKGCIARFNMNWRDKEGVLTTVLKVNMDTYGGCSGSAVVDITNGKIIGVTTSTWEPGYFIGGIIPIETVWACINKTSLGRKIRGEING